jgi:uncharacterized protein YkwD
MFTLPFSARASLFVVTCFISGCIPIVSVGQHLKEFDGDYLESPRGGPDLERAEEEIFRLTNDFRKAEGRAPLKWNNALRRAAAYFAAYMARTDKYGHEADGNEPAERVTAYGYDYCLEAENIAYQMQSKGFATQELARQFFEVWRESPPHRQNILDADVMDVGIAIGYSPKTDRYYAVQSIGRPTSMAIRFEVTNRTEEPLRYTVSKLGNQNEAPKQFELPPHSKMLHWRCRRSTIDWGWSKTDDRQEAKGGREYVVENAGGEFRVTESQASEQEPNTVRVPLLMR